MDVPPFSEEDFTRLGGLFRSLGAEEASAGVMARQLLRRAVQVAAEDGGEPWEALEGLVRKMIAARSEGHSYPDLA